LQLRYGAIVSAIVILLTAAGQTSARPTTKKKKGKPTRTVTTQPKSKGAVEYPAVPGAGQVVPATDALQFLQPVSPQAFRDLLVASYGAPTWFPVPDSFVQAKGAEGPIEFLSASLFNMGAGATSAKTSGKPSTDRVIDVSYRTTFANQEAAYQWVLAALAPSGLAIRSDKLSGEDRVILFGDPGTNPSVNVRIMKKATFAKSGTSVEFRVLERVTTADMPAQPGYFSATDFPTIAGPLTSLGTSLFATGFTNTSYLGSHVAQFTVFPTDLDSVRATLNNPDSYTGPFKLAGPLTVEGAKWKAKLSYFGRPAELLIRHNAYNVDEYYVDITLPFGYR
jgi:hypothetical protein